MSLNLHLLRAFMTVIEQNSFSRAAEALFVSQPAVSKAVRDLEHEVGQPLLERGSRRLRLTEAGELLLERAQAIFSIVRTTEEDVRALSSLEQGVLRVGASTTVATYLLPPVLAAFHANYPGVDLRLTSQNTQVIVDRLRDYQLDVALVEGPVAEPWVRSEPWRDDELVVIASRQHPLAPHPGHTKNTLERIAQETFLIREPGSGTREVAADALRQHGVTLGRTVELGSTEAIKQAVAAGLGISIVSRAALSDQLALGRLVILAVDGLEIRRTFNRLSVAGRAPSRSAQAFNALLDAPLVAR